MGRDRSPAVGCLKLYEMSIEVIRICMRRVGGGVRYKGEINGFIEGGVGRDRSGP